MRTSSFLQWGNGLSALCFYALITPFIVVSRVISLHVIPCSDVFVVFFLIRSDPPINLQRWNNWTKRYPALLPPVMRRKPLGKSVRDQVRSHWATRTLQPALIDHLSHVNVLPSRTVATPAASQASTPLLPVRSEILENYPSAKSLQQILSDPHVTEFWLFSFQLHVDYIFSLLASNRDVRVHLVGEQRTVVAERPIPSYPNLIFHSVRIPRSWGSHHSKLIFCVRDDNTFQMHVPSFNLSREEISLVRQMIWTSPCIRKLTTSTISAAMPSRFQKQVLSYLDQYPGSMLQELYNTISRYDFSPLDKLNCQFVYSTPYGGGLSMLKGCVGPESVDTFPNVFIQVSSIGNRVRRRYQFLNDIVLPYLYTDCFDRESLKQDTPYVANPELLWPTKHEMEHCATRGLSRGWFFYKPDEALRPALRKHGGRGVLQVPSHTKYYAEYTDVDKIGKPQWVLFTSHNLSQSAWGATPWERPSSYECGILYKRTDKGRTIDLRLNWAGDEPMDDSIGEGETMVKLMTPYPLDDLERYRLDDDPHVSVS